MSDAVIPGTLRGKALNPAPTGRRLSRSTVPSEKSKSRFCTFRPDGNAHARSPYKFLPCKPCPAPGGDPGLSCGRSRGFQVTQNDLWELQECLQTPQSQKKQISALEGARQPVGSSFGPLRNVFTQPRPRADIGWIEIPQRSSPCRTEIVLPFRSDTPEGPTVHHRADGRPDILHGAIVGDGRETWQSRLSGSGRFRLPGCIP